MRQSLERAYDMSDVKSLINNASPRNWDDLLRYLKDANGNATLDEAQVPQLIEDVSHLKDDNVRFTTDYRIVWQKLTGTEASTSTGLDGAAAVREPPRANVKNSRVQDVLRRVNSPEYRQMNAALDWDDSQDKRTH